MRAVIIIIALIVALLAILVGAIATGVYFIEKDFPDYARKDVVYAAYTDFLGAVDTAVAESDSMLSLAARLEKLERPEELIYLALEKSDADDFGYGDTERLEIVKSFEDGTFRSTLINGTGHGRVNGRNIVIIEHDIDAFELEHCVIYMERQ